MPDREKVIKKAERIMCSTVDRDMIDSFCEDVIALLEEQEKKQINLHKKHVITWGRSDEFTMRKLYEAVCETLLDEGELIISRTDDHEKVDFVFYVLND